MSFPRYPKYKDTGIEWLGEVPAHWMVLPCRAVVTERTAKNEGAACQDYLSVLANVGVIPYAEKGDIGNKKPEDLSKCKLVTKGDLIINSMNYGIGSYGLSSHAGVCSPVYIVLSVRDDVVERGFAYRIFENRAFQKFAQSFGNGILEHRCAINWDILKGLRICVPPLEEQKRILAFLDRETAKIDAVVSEQKRLIELLEEKRQASISHAITKGLNPGATMTPSGVDWLGEVPAHWAVKSIRHLAEVLRGKFTHRPRNDPAFYDGDFPFVQTGDITSASRFITGYKQTLNERGIAVSKQFPKGTLVMAIAANIGDVAILDFPAYFPDSIVGLVPRDSVRLMFLYYLMIGMKQTMLMTATVSTQMNLNVEQISSLKACCPPVWEQDQIIKHLDTKLEQFDSLMAEAQRAVDLLQERRAALISAAVTGQIDVRAIAGKAAA